MKYHVTCEKNGPDWTLFDTEDEAKAYAERLATLCLDQPSYHGVCEGTPDDQRAIGWAWGQGRTDGKAAASWVTDGNTSTVAYRGLLKGIDEGDPAILDAILDGLTRRNSDEVIAEALEHAELGEHADEWLAEAIVQNYGDGFTQGAVDEVERTARYHLEDVDA